MTDVEKHEMSQLISDAVFRAMEQHCPMGISPETAHELITFAQTWKTCRKVMITGVVATVAGGLLTALWSGIKTVLGR
jgi:hypothetical protein